MEYYSFCDPSEQSICIDPKLLVFGAGEGVNDPNYDSPLHTINTAIGITQGSDTNFDPYHGTAVDQDSTSEEDAEHESLEDFPLTPRHPALDPEAEPFVPAIHTDTSVQGDAEIGLEPLHPVQSPPTPRIEVSKPNEIGTNRKKSITDEKRRKSRSQSRQSSPRRRSSSISRPRAPSTSRKASPIPKAMAAKLITALEDLPANRQGPYTVGDRTTPLKALHIHASYPPPMPLQEQAHPGMPTLGPGYGCNHAGCAEFDKRWETKSERDHHERKHLPVDRRAHACKVCGKTFHFPKDVSRHMVVHDGSKVDCPVCGKAYSRADNLKRHIKTQHGQTSSMGSASQMSGNSPTPSLITSFTQSPVDDIGHDTPFNLSPLAAKSTPWSKNAHNRHDSVNEPTIHESHSRSESPLSSQPMSKSLTR